MHITNRQNYSKQAEFRAVDWTIFFSPIEMDKNYRLKYVRFLYYMSCKEGTGWEFQMKHKNTSAWN